MKINWLGEITPVELDETGRFVTVFALELNKYYLVTLDEMPKEFEKTSIPHVQ